MKYFIILFFCLLIGCKNNQNEQSINSNDSQDEQIIASDYNQSSYPSTTRANEQNVYSVYKSTSENSWLEVPYINGMIFYIGPFDGLNLRKEPNLTSEIIRVLPQNTKLIGIESDSEVYEIRRANERIRGEPWRYHYWYKVDADGEIGWVFSAYLTIYDHSDARSKKPVVMLGLLQFPDLKEIILYEEKLYGCKIDTIKVYDDINRNSDFVEINNAAGTLYKLNATEEWLYFVGEKTHGFIYVYDISGESSYYHEADLGEYEIIQKCPYVKRYGPLLEIKNLNGTITQFWNFHRHGYYEISNERAVFCN